MSQSVTTVVRGKAVNTTFSGDIPANYDRYLGPLFFEPYAFEVGRRIATIRPSRLLELACGSGRVTKRLCESLEGVGVVTATDISPAMIEEARRNVSADNVEWNVVDAMDLPYPDNSFDAVVCQFGIMFVPDRVRAYMEARRVLKPGGTVLVSSWDSLEANPIAQPPNELLHQFFPDNTPRFYEIPFSYNDESIMRHEFKDAGFEEVTIELVQHEGSNESAEDAAIGLLEGNPVIREIQERNPGALPEMKRQLADRIAARFGRGHIAVPLSAWYMTAKKS